MQVLYDGYYMYDRIERAHIVHRCRKQAEWNNAEDVLKQLPVSAHLLLLQSSTVSDLYAYRTYSVPAMEGTLAVCKSLFTQMMLPDAFLQIAIGLQAMHKVGIIHQALNDQVIYVVRNNQYCCGYLLIIGGFAKSGARVLGQSSLNPTRPAPDWDVAAFYELGLSYKIDDWPRFHNLCYYHAWLWMKPVAYRFEPSERLICTLDAYQKHYPVAQRLLYIFKCAKAGMRCLNEVPMLVYPCDAQLLAIAESLQNRSYKCDATVAKCLNQSILELLTLVLWETPEVKEIYELKQYIQSQIDGTQDTEMPEFVAHV